MGPAGRPAGTPAPGHQHPHPAPLSAVRRRRTPIRPALRHRGVRLRGGGRHRHQRRRHPCRRLRAVHRPWRVHHQRRRRIPDRHRVQLRLMLQSSRATNPADWPGGRAPGSGRPDVTLPAGLIVGVRGPRPTPLQAQPHHAQRASDAARPTHGGPGRPVGDACGPRRGHLPGRSGQDRRALGRRTGRNAYLRDRQWQPNDLVARERSPEYAQAAHGFGEAWDRGRAARCRFRCRRMPRTQPRPALPGPIMRPPRPSVGQSGCFSMCSSTRFEISASVLSSFGVKASMKSRRTCSTWTGAAASIAA